ncbi:hypothetical protein C0Q70_07150 [Pomacea canaliculata]|uniref:Uncharacterized protein n=1 Tax=Pomacea canaliculata TaxID=400727 RepID=A0A2T7PE93_POMCA|nr:hypothetical protein C0Q70_07150 [Pomacea canaliculata]
MSQAGEIYVMLLKSFARAHVRYEDRERAAIQPWAFPALGRHNEVTVEARKYRGGDESFVHTMEMSYPGDQGAKPSAKVRLTRHNLVD